MPIPRSGTAGLGVLLYLAGVAMFAVNDALGKWLVKDYGVGQLMLLRTIGAGVVLAPMVLSLRVKLIDPRRPALQVLRVLCAAADTFAFYYATRTMPLADVMTFYMATPLIVTALSAPLLGEKVERFRWIAVLVGFVGVLIALRPSSHMLSWGAPIALIRSDCLCAEPGDHPRPSRHPLDAARSLAIRRHGSRRGGDHSLGMDDAQPF